MAALSLVLLISLQCLLVAAVSLACDGWDDLPESFFSELDVWQSKYSRDSIKMSREFLYGIFEPKILPRLEEAFRQCPIAVLEIMMNTVLALDTDRSSGEAAAMFKQTMGMAHEAAEVWPEVAEQLIAWKDDTAHVYPYLFGTRKRHCHGSSVKIFVYDIPENLTSPLIQCHHGQWGTEVLFHQYLLNAACRTEDPHEADFFYVPVYGTCLHVHNDNPLEDSLLVWDHLVDYLARQPTFQRRNRLDHIFLFADGQGARLWESYDIVSSESIFLMVESKCPTWDLPARRYTDVISCHSAWKDVIIPGHIDHARKRHMQIHNRPSQERDLLMTFHGRHPGTHEVYAACAVRGKVMELDGYPGVDVGGFVPDYLERKGRSHFCLVPGGTSPWTNHLYESFFSGCIPVILSDQYEVAFQHVVPWHKVSIKWPEAAVDQLYEYLANFSANELSAMKAEVDWHACWFDYLSEDVDCSPYLAILRKLDELKRHFPVQHGQFWNAAPALSRFDRTGGPPRETRFHVTGDENFRLPF